jgi:hypothetical protein
MGDYIGESAKGEIEVRWGLREDEARVAELLELNGMPRWSAFEERYIVAEKRGEVLAALGYRTASKRLFLGLLVVDPWGGERRLAEALYAGALVLAWEAGIGEVRVRMSPGGDYPSKVGYRCRRGGWYADTALFFGEQSELPKGDWRRVLALLGIVSVPFFRVFRP